MALVNYSSSDLSDTDDKITATETVASVPFVINAAPDVDSPNIVAVPSKQRQQVRRKTIKNKKRTSNSKRRLPKYECDDCGLKCSTKFNLERHISRLHSRSDSDDSSTSSSFWDSDNKDLRPRRNQLIVVHDKEERESEAEVPQDHYEVEKILELYRDATGKPFEAKVQWKPSVVAIDEIAAPDLINEFLEEEANSFNPAIASLD